MQIKENQALTPNKKQYIIDQINGELDSASQSIQEGDLNAITIGGINKAKNELQLVLNKFLEKKGVITPSETADAIEKINTLKKARLQEDYILGIMKATWFLVAIGVIGVSAYLYYKKRAK
jgi:hypothetical protein